MRLYRLKMWKEALMMEMRRAPQEKLHLLMQRFQLLDRAVQRKLEPLPPRQVLANDLPYSSLHPVLQLPVDLGRGEESGCPGVETEEVNQVRKRRRKKNW